MKNQNYYNSITDIIGNTPLLKLHKFNVGKCNLFIKIESLNPGGSIKDRIALAMIDEAEKSGKLKEGQIIVEATAGNTGISLAIVAAKRNYRSIIIVPDKMSKNKISHIKALGAEVIVTRSDVHKGHPDYYMDLAYKTAKDNNAFFVNQFSNEANYQAHFDKTAPELFSQLSPIDAIIVGVGSGGTATGIGQYIKHHNLDTELICADPDGSIFASIVNDGIQANDVGSWLVEGIGQDIVPPIMDLSLFTSAFSITDKEAFKTARDLIKKEGVNGGSSTGTLLAAALKYCQKQEKPKNVVTFCCDTGDKYLEKMYNDDWMISKGML